MVIKGKPHIRLKTTEHVLNSLKRPTNPMTTTRTRNMVTALCEMGILSMNAYKFRKKLELNSQFKIVLINNLEHGKS